MRDAFVEQRWEGQCDIVKRGQSMRGQSVQVGEAMQLVNSDPREEA
jgi:hypothetical protein